MSWYVYIGMMLYPPFYYFHVLVQVCWCTALSCEAHLGSQNVWSMIVFAFHVFLQRSSRCVKLWRIWWGVSFYTLIWHDAVSIIPLFPRAYSGRSDLCSAGVSLFVLAYWGCECGPGPGTSILLVGVWHFRDQESDWSFTTSDSRASAF